MGWESWRQVAVAFPPADRGGPVTDLDDFLETFVPRQVDAERALLNGEAEGRNATWSHRDPVTLFGAQWSGSGWDELSEVFKWLADHWSKGKVDFELLAAGVSGDLAYTVGYEQTSASLEGGPVQQFGIRVTHVYRREDGEWKIVHRHGDWLHTDPIKPATC